MNRSPPYQGRIDQPREEWAQTVRRVERLVRQLSPLGVQLYSRDGVTVHRHAARNEASVTLRWLGIIFEATVIDAVADDDAMIRARLLTMLREVTRMAAHFAFNQYEPEVGGPVPERWQEWRTGWLERLGVQPDPAPVPVPQSTFYAASEGWVVAVDQNRRPS